MDGIAVLADRARDASPVRPLDCHPVNTGDPLPQGTDAVIRRRRIRRIGERTVEIREPAVPWHVRSVEEDAAQGEMILPAHHRVRPVDLGMLLAAAVEEGSADVGPGTLAVARRFGLDFLSLGSDPFDPVIPLEVAENEAGRMLIDLIRSDAFRAGAASLEKGDFARPADGRIQTANRFRTGRSEKRS